MRIDLLELQNFKGFEKAAFRFTPGMNLIIGDNGTGKTALLEALKIPIHQILTALKMGEYGSDESYVRIVSNGQSIEEQYPCRVEHKFNFENIDYFQELRYSKAKPGLKTSGNTIEKKNINDFLDKIANGNEEILFPLLIYYDIGRLSTKSEDDEKYSFIPNFIKYSGTRKTGYVQNWQADIKPELIKELFIIFDYARLSGQPDQVALDVLNFAAKTCWPDFQSFKYHHKTKDLLVEIEKQKFLPFSLLSDGQRNTLAMVAELAIRCYILNPQLGAEAAQKTPGVVLIDELDLHLHPNWQREIIPALKRAFPLVQFFATTHSPFLIQGLDIEKGDQLIDLNYKKDNGYMENADFNSALGPFGDKSLEEIVEHYMKVKGKRSVFYETKLENAKRYFEYLNDLPDDATTEQLLKIQEDLGAMEAAFSDDPAYVAFLQVKRANQKF